MRALPLISERSLCLAVNTQCETRSASYRKTRVSAINLAVSIAARSRINHCEKGHDSERTRCVPASDEITVPRQILYNARRLPLAGALTPEDNARSTRSRITADHRRAVLRAIFNFANCCAQAAHVHEDLSLSVSLSGAITLWQIISSVGMHRCYLPFVCSAPTHGTHRS